MNTSNLTKMNIIELNKNPPVYIVKELYNEEERFKIYNELLFLQHKLADETATGPAEDDKGKTLTSKKGEWLEEVYANRKMSDILNINRKTYDIIKEIKHWYFSYKDSYTDYTLVSYYEEADYYKPHIDKCFITSISWFYNKPKNFLGGNLQIPSLNLTIPCEDNTMVLFPGALLEHSVTEISMIDKNREKSGRFSISQFVHIRSN